MIRRRLVWCLIRIVDFYHETEAPIVLDDTTNKFEKGRPKIRVYTSVDSRFILEDFIAKLEVLYGKGFDTK